MLKLQDFSNLEHVLKIDDKHKKGAQDEEH